MKTLFLTLLIATTLVNPIFLTSHQCATSEINISTFGEKGYNLEYNTIFNTMKKGMNDAPNTGNVNLDFVVEMIPHHEGGINMAKAIIKYGSNPAVKKIAENIVTSQEAQIPIMMELKSKFEKEPPSNKESSESYIKKYNEIKDNMFKEMEGVKITDNVDVNFLQQMIYHHEGAIAMAKDILGYTKDPDIKKLAENIVSTQSKGVQEMKSLLKTLQNN
ncbi:DUF305 domain-containing protein [Clostridium paraputrificum]|uniref:DUF305 domain-containing protein n=1 Tax=Clostridium paraputrificum TaxID=29363 RepID=UPI003D339F00